MIPCLGQCISSYQNYFSTYTIVKKTFGSYCWGAATGKRPQKDGHVSGARKAACPTSLQIVTGAVEIVYIFALPQIFYLY
jgi:hypothetical protein